VVSLTHMCVWRLGNSMVTTVQTMFAPGCFFKCKQICQLCLACCKDLVRAVMACCVGLVATVSAVTEKVVLKLIFWILVKSGYPARVVAELYCMDWNFLNFTASFPWLYSTTSLAVVMHALHSRPHITCPSTAEHCQVCTG